MIIKTYQELKEVITSTKCRHSYVKNVYIFKGLYGDKPFTSRYCVKCEGRPNAFLRAFLE